MEKKERRREAERVRPGERLPFSAPKLFQYGRISSLTLSVGNSGSDVSGQSMQMRVP